jgi:hypothetical protein
MIKITRTFTRPSTSISWYQQVLIPDENFLKRWDDYYVKSGKVITWDSQLHPDQLSNTYTAIWNSLEDFHEYDHDELLDNWWNTRDEYNSSVGIQIGPKILEIFKDNTSTIVTIPEGNWNLVDYS